MTQERLAGLEAELRERAEAVRERVGRAAERAGRSGSDVEILPVTKGHTARRLEEIVHLGFRMIGENRVGEAEDKQGELGRMGVRWHMVGHLQRNKAGTAVELFDVVESVDSVRLARKLDRELEKREMPELEVLLQVNASGEGSKFGLPVDDSPGQSDEEVGQICALPRLRVRGLMTMAPLTDDEEVLRRTFARTRRVFERYADDMEGFVAETLSMGMSNDFELAVEEGSTRLRLGTVLVGERPR